MPTFWGSYIYPEEINLIGVNYHPFLTNITLGEERSLLSHLNRKYEHLKFGHYEEVYTKKKRYYVELDCMSFESLQQYQNFYQDAKLLILYPTWESYEIYDENDNF